MDYRGFNLFDILLESPKYFTQDAVCKVAISVMHRIESLHKLGFIHRDIKPGNILVENCKAFRKISLIDFGLAKRYVGPKGMHNKPAISDTFAGSVKFASINAHNGFELSRRDDLISLFYVLVWLSTENLPWIKISCLGGSPKSESKLLATKQSNNLLKLSYGLPKYFKLFAEEISQLEFEDKPDYELYRSFFKDPDNQRKSFHEYSTQPDLSPDKSMTPMSLEDLHYIPIK